MELDAIPQTVSTETTSNSTQVHPTASSSIVKTETYRITFCYGLMVFLGLALSLLALTLLVIYVGVLSQQTLFGTNFNQIIYMILLRSLPK